MPVPTNGTFTSHISASVHEQNNMIDNQLTEKVRATFPTDPALSLTKDHVDAATKIITQFFRQQAEPISDKDPENQKAATNKIIAIIRFNQICEFIIDTQNFILVRILNEPKNKQNIIHAIATNLELETSQLTKTADVNMDQLISLLSSFNITDSYDIAKIKRGYEIISYRTTQVALPLFNQTEEYSYPLLIDALFKHQVEHTDHLMTEQMLSELKAPLATQLRMLLENIKHELTNTYTSLDDKWKNARKCIADFLGVDINNHAQDIDYIIAEIRLNQFLAQISTSPIPRPVLKSLFTEYKGLTRSADTKLIINPDLILSLVNYQPAIDYLTHIQSQVATVSDILASLPNPNQLIAASSQSNQKLAENLYAENQFYWMIIEAQKEPPTGNSALAKKLSDIYNTNEVARKHLAQLFIALEPVAIKELWSALKESSLDEKQKIYANCIAAKTMKLTMTELDLAFNTLRQELDFKSDTQTVSDHSTKLKYLQQQTGADINDLEKLINKIDQSTTTLKIALADLLQDNRQKLTSVLDTTKSREDINNLLSLPPNPEITIGNNKHTGQANIAKAIYVYQQRIKLAELALEHKNLSLADALLTEPTGTVDSVLAEKTPQVITNLLISTIKATPDTALRDALVTLGIENTSVQDKIICETHITATKEKHAIYAKPNPDDNTDKVHYPYLANQLYQHRLTAACDLLNVEEKIRTIASKVIDELSVTTEDNSSSWKKAQTEISKALDLSNTTFNEIKINKIIGEIRFNDLYYNQVLTRSHAATTLKNLLSKQREAVVEKLANQAQVTLYSLQDSFISKAELAKQMSLAGFHDTSVTDKDSSTAYLLGPDSSIVNSLYAENQLLALAKRGAMDPHHPEYRNWVPGLEQALLNLRQHPYWADLETLLAALTPTSLDQLWQHLYDKKPFPQTSILPPSITDAKREAALAVLHDTAIDRCLKQESYRREYINQFENQVLRNWLIDHQINLFNYFEQRVDIDHACQVLNTWLQQHSDLPEASTLPADMKLRQEWYKTFNSKFEQLSGKKLPMKSHAFLSNDNTISLLIKDQQRVNAIYHLFSVLSDELLDPADYKLATDARSSLLRDILIRKGYRIDSNIKHNHPTLKKIRAHHYKNATELKELLAEIVINPTNQPLDLMDNISTEIVSQQEVLVPQQLLGHLSKQKTEAEICYTQSQTLVEKVSRNSSIYKALAERATIIDHTILIEHAETRKALQAQQQILTDQIAKIDLHIKQLTTTLREWNCADQQLNDGSILRVTPYTNSNEEQLMCIEFLKIVKNYIKSIYPTISNNNLDALISSLYAEFETNDLDSESLNSIIEKYLPGSDLTGINKRIQWAYQIYQAASHSLFTNTEYPLCPSNIATLENSLEIIDTVTNDLQENTPEHLVTTFAYRVISESTANTLHVPNTEELKKRVQAFVTEFLKENISDHSTIVSLIDQWLLKTDLTLTSHEKPILAMDFYLTYLSRTMVDCRAILRANDPELSLADITAEEQHKRLGNLELEQQVEALSEYVLTNGRKLQKVRGLVEKLTEQKNELQKQKTNLDHHLSEFISITNLYDQPDTAVNHYYQANNSTTIEYHSEAEFKNALRKFAAEPLAASSYAQISSEGLTPIKKQTTGGPEYRIHHREDTTYSETFNPKTGRYALQIIARPQLPTSKPATFEQCIDTAREILNIALANKGLPLCVKTGYHDKLLGMALACIIIEDNKLFNNPKTRSHSRFQGQAFLSGAFTNPESRYLKTYRAYSIEAYRNKTSLSTIDLYSCPAALANQVTQSYLGKQTLFKTFTPGVGALLSSSPADEEKPIRTFQSIVRGA